jgi:murein DD-endopeptidase MepM/ murein hydrolase activator NlpD
MIKPNQRPGRVAFEETPMRRLWGSAAAIAFAAASVGACVSPHYPIREDQSAGPPPLSAPKPQYPISEAAPAPRSDAAPIEQADTAPAARPAGIPARTVEREALPSLTPASVSEPASAAAPGDSTAAAPAPSDGAMAPHSVTHDVGDAPPPPQPAPPPAPAQDAALAYAAGPASRHQVTHETIAGDVVRASGIFEDYEVQKGDHIDALARAFNTSRSVLLDANSGLRAPYRLRPGQILRVPVSKAYVAEHGDTLSGVARRFGVEADYLAQLNHISEHAPLRAGQKIGLPSSMRDRGPFRTRESEPQYVDNTPRRQPTETASGGVPFGAYQAQRAQAPGGVYATPASPGYHMTPAAPSAPSAGYATVSPPHLTPPQAAPALSDAQVTAATRGRFVWPLRGDVVSNFGPGAVGQRNDGIDIKAPQGTSVRASAAGQVVYAGDQVKGGFGKLVLVEHSDGWFTAYAHLDSISVHMMDQVTQGQELGQVGMTGDANQPMLHFEIRYHPAPGAKTQPVDPALALPTG